MAWPPLPPCLHLSVTVFEHTGRLLSSVADALAPASPVAGVVAGIADEAGGVLASGVAGADGGIEASGAVAAGADASGVVGWAAGVVSCAKAAVLSASADAKRIIFILSFLQPLVGE